ncbi:glucose-1-phosphate adenylyltransferase subunit GlgD [Ruminococcaceae bacterium OttesenSCG-928-A16]|nr:glucose-1-phosphate adenylyltransferase subunit GlgD [Ruminococcaceae bacterium OttesenSCG-928-A16]
MRSANAMGIIFANMHDENIPELIARRTMASAPFAGRYRMIDFVLSGMSVAGMQNIGVVVRNNYQSLMDHLGNGREWDLSRKRGGLAIFPPGAQGAGNGSQGRIEALGNVIDYLSFNKEELVVMSDCDIACDLDYAALIKEHSASGADVTVVYEKAPIKDSLLEDNITYVLGQDGYVSEIRVNDYKKGMQNLSMSVYIIERELLLNVLKDAIVRGYESFEKDILARNLTILKVRGYEYTGYRARISDMRSYFDENLRLLEHENLKALFPKERQVYTKVRDEAPVRYAIGSQVTNCIVADGCIIEGEVENSVLFRGVRVGKGVKIKNCVIMQGTVIEPGAQMENVVTDKNVKVCEGVSLRGAKGFPVFVGKGQCVE